MRVIELQASNIKRLRAVSIVPQGNVVTITGANGAGKTSVLDAIQMAIAGAGAIPAKPIRTGQDEARIQLDMGEIIVRREFSAAGTRLSVENGDGARYPRPQEFVDKLFGELTFDPLAFTRMKPRARLDALRKLVKLDVDVEKLDEDNALDFARRTDVNRVVKTLTEREKIAREKVNPEADVTPIDLKPFLDEMQNAVEFNNGLQRAKNEHAERQRYLAERMTELEQVNAEIRRLEERRDMLTGWIANERESITMQGPFKDPIDIAELRQRYEQAEAENRIRVQQQRLREIHGAAKEELEGKKKEAAALTERMEKRAQQKADALAAAIMPIPGLSFGDGEVTYNSIPFEQASSAEQLRVSFAMAMAMNPKLRVVLIRDGSLLDANNLAAITEMAEANDFQVWIEKAEIDGKVGILLEDGEVVAIDGEPVPTAAQLDGMM